MEKEGRGKGIGGRRGRRKGYRGWRGKGKEEEGEEEMKGFSMKN
jgi:hypothetical protein